MHRLYKLIFKQNVREAYVQFFQEQECDPVTVLVGINLILLLRNRVVHT